MNTTIICCIITTSAAILSPLATKFWESIFIPKKSFKTEKPKVLSEYLGLANIAIDNPSISQRHEYMDIYGKALAYASKKQKKLMNEFHNAFCSRFHIKGHLPDPNLREMQAIFDDLAKSI